MLPNCPAYMHSHLSLCRLKDVNDLRREPIKKPKPVRKQSAKSRIAISSSSGVVEFRSPIEFPEDVFESAHMLNKILQHDLRPGLLMGRRVTVRYSDDKVDSGNTRYYADGVVTETKLMKTMVKVGFICFFSHCLHFHLPYLFHLDHDSVRRRQHGAGAQLTLVH